MTYLKGSPQEERRAQSVLLDELDAKFSPVVAKEIRGASDEMIAGFERTGAAPQLPLSHQSNLHEIYLNMIAASIASFGNRILVQAKQKDIPLEYKESFAELFARLALEYISSELIRRRIASVAETTRRQVVSAITRGQEAGDTLDEITRSILEVLPAASRTRAHIIARTETHGASNFGANEAAKATGLRLQKEWVSVGDARTRSFGQNGGPVSEYDHWSMDGQTVDMDQPFKMPHISGQPINAMYPGDPSLPAAASVNCRCGVAHVVQDF